MKYDNSEIRRQDRLLAEDRAMELIKESEYGFLAMADEGAGYGVPVNYAFDGGNSLYIHCAGEGKNSSALRNRRALRSALSENHRLLPKNSRLISKALFFPAAQ